MSLGKRIKQCRQSCGLSQEKLAELVGVTRQAVTKWESDQSAPNTDNLFRLAEVFGTTVDLLMSSEESESRSMIEEVYAVIKREEQQKAVARQKMVLDRIRAALAAAGAYLLIYLIGRIIWCRSPKNTFLGFLLFSRPSGEHSYLYGWLLSSELFWWSMTVSTTAAGFGRFRLCAATIGGFTAGLLLGILFGPYPAGIPYGHGHYGWAIWGGVFLLSIAAGTVWEHIHARKSRS